MPVNMELIGTLCPGNQNTLFADQPLFAQLVSKGVAHCTSKMGWPEVRDGENKAQTNSLASNGKYHLERPNTFVTELQKC